MFKSDSVIEHVVRGIVGFGLLGVGLLYSPVLGWWTLVPLAGALVCFRGCPMCWTAGLVETVLHRKAQQSCIDGSCTREHHPSISAVPHAIGGVWRVADWACVAAVRRRLRKYSVKMSSKPSSPPSPLA
jgi:hypothetical protein